jgi:hypothetical protein
MPDPWICGRTLWRRLFCWSPDDESDSPGNLALNALPRGAASFIRPSLARFGWSLSNDLFATVRKVLKIAGMARLRDTKGWESALLCLLIANLLIVVVLAASPQLHQLLHPDADRSEHECAVTVMLSGGSDDSPVSQVFDAGAILPIALHVLPEMGSRDVAPLFLGAYVFEHAPPLV